MLIASQIDVITQFNGRFYYYLKASSPWRDIIDDYWRNRQKQSSVIFGCILPIRNAYSGETPLFLSVVMLLCPLVQSLKSAFASLPHA